MRPVIKHFFLWEALRGNTLTVRVFLARLPRNTLTVRVFPLMWCASRISRLAALSDMQMGSSVRKSFKYDETTRTASESNKKAPPR